jgi:DNA-binding NtrC family response regulator
MSALRLVFVDDDDTLRKVLTRELSTRSFEVEAFASAEGVLESVRSRPPQAVLLDLFLPGVTGLELLASIRALDPSQAVVVLTAHGSVEQAVEAMRAGAQDFLTKPVRLDVLEQTLLRAAETHALSESNARLRRAVGADRAPPILGQSEAVRALRADIERVAQSDGSLLVQGEHGTGKELVARHVHARSRRAAEPFVVINCGALPESLVESELFGHEKGAFTGADRRRMGLFEAAHGGSLFLDELGELPRAVQPALLRALQFGEVRPVGGERTRLVDVRVIAATNRDLEQEVRAGAFREDLFWRVTTLRLDVPPLRGRREDVRELAVAFLARAAARAGRALSFDSDALERLAEHEWPGNVRELENAAERLVVMASGTRVDRSTVERHVLTRTGLGGELPTLELATLERLAVEAAMRRSGGDKRAAAESLGIALKTLYNKLDRFGLRPPRDPRENEAC